MRRKHILLRIVVFVVVLLVMMEVGESIWGVDEENTLLAPDWFSFLLIGVCFASTYFAPKLLGLFKRIRIKENIDDRCENISEIKRSAFNKQQTAESEIYPNISEEEILSAEEFVKEAGFASTSMLQRKFYYRYTKAAAIIDELEIRGIIGPYEGTLERRIMNPDHAKCGLRDIDKMEGHDFEYWCADLLRKNGFYNVEVTQGSGDHGVDILAVKDGVSYAVQCKCYSHDLGNTPVQEIYAGKEMYGCQVAAVMTNRHFTAGGKALAEKTRVLLWDRDTLIDMLNK